MTGDIIDGKNESMKPSDLIGRSTPVDWTQRVVDALAQKPMSQTALRIRVGMTNMSQCQRWPAFLDDLAARGLVRVWRETAGDKPGRPAVMVALAAPAASGSTIDGQAEGGTGLTGEPSS